MAGGRFRSVITMPTDRTHRQMEPAPKRGNRNAEEISLKPRRAPLEGFRLCHGIDAGSIIPSVSRIGSSAAYNPAGPRRFQGSIIVSVGSHPSPPYVGPVWSPRSGTGCLTGFPLPATPGAGLSRGGFGHNSSGECRNESIRAAISGYIQIDGE